MHAHNQTLIQRMGFNDPDHRDPIHDLACAYMADNARRIMDLAFGSTMVQCFAQQEVHVGSKDFSIAFLDVVVYEGSYEGVQPSLLPRLLVPIEVKAKPSRDVLRQLSFYQARWDWIGFASKVYGYAVDAHRIEPPRWVLATLYPITGYERAGLQAMGVRHVRLSEEKIRVWAQARGMAEDSPEL